MIRQTLHNQSRPFVHIYNQLVDVLDLFNFILSNLIIDCFSLFFTKNFFRLILKLIVGVLVQSGSCCKSKPAVTVFFGCFNAYIGFISADSRGESPSA